MSSLSTHVLDTAAGLPAVGVPVTLERRTGDDWQQISGGVTDDDGRIGDLAPVGLGSGIYRLVFDTGAYFAATGQSGFYPQVPVVFEVHDVDRSHHVPLLLSPYAYSTYRGS